jgi:MarR family 2-MHQ and catechol resistance regulon transcriptional repressor
VPTPQAVDAGERDALSAFVKFMRAYESLRARLEPAITEHGVTTTQFGVLEALSHLGPMNQRRLGEKILTSTGNLTTVLDNLERDGLVERAPVEGDRRQNLVQLTERGKRRIEKIFPQQARAIVRELGVLTRQEQKTLGALCRKLGLGGTS